MAEYVKQSQYQKHNQQLDITSIKDTHSVIKQQQGMCEVLIILATAKMVSDEWIRQMSVSVIYHLKQQTQWNMKDYLQVLRSVVTWHKSNAMDDSTTPIISLPLTPYIFKSPRLASYVGCPEYNEG